MSFQLNAGHRIVVLAVGVIVLTTLQVEALFWGELVKETVPSVDVYTSPGIRDVLFSPRKCTTLRLTWTINKGNEDVVGILVDVALKRTSGEADEMWVSSPTLTFLLSFSLMAGSAFKYTRDLISLAGEAYQANVTLLTKTSNTSVIVEGYLEPQSPRSVHLTTLTESSMFASLNLPDGRTDAYSGKFEEYYKYEGYFGPISFPVPLFTGRTMNISTNLPSKLTRGGTYRLLLATFSWGVRSSILGTSNERTVAPSTPVIDELKQVSQTLLRIQWRLPVGIADTFLIVLNREKTVIKENSSRVSEGRYATIFPYVNTQTRYDLTMTAESNNVQGEPSEMLTYHRTEDGGFTTDSMPDKTSFDVIVPWVVSGVLAVIVLVLAGILGLTVRKCRQLPKESTNHGEIQPEYETIGSRSSYLHPIHM